MLKFTPCDDKWGWFLVSGFWFLVSGRWSLDSGHWWLVAALKFAVSRSQRLSVKHRSEVKQLT